MQPTICQLVDIGCTEALVECSAKLNDHISVVTGSLFVNCVIAISLSLSGTERRELKVTQDLEPDIIRFLKRTLSVTRKETISINQSIFAEKSYS